MTPSASLGPILRVVSVVPSVFVVADPRLQANSKKVDAVAANTKEKNFFFKINLLLINTVKHKNNTYVVNRFADL